MESKSSAVTVLAAATFAAALFLPGCSAPGASDAEDGSTTITVAQAAFQDYAAIAVGIEEGIFEDHGIRLDIMNTDFSGAQDLLIGEQADVAASNEAQVVLQNAQGHDTTLAFPYFFFAGGGLMYSPDEHPDWVTFDEEADGVPANYEEALTAVLEQAVGSSVGVTAAGAEYATFLGMLTTAGLSANDFTIIDLAAEDMPPALINGSIDIMISGIPQRLAVLEQGFTTLVDQTAVPDTIAHAGFSARRSWVDENPELAQEFEAALLETMAFIRDNPDSSFATISSELKKSGTELEAESIAGIWNVMEVFLTSPEEFATDVFAEDGRFYWESRFQSVVDEHVKSGKIEDFDTSLEDLYYGKKIIEGRDN